VSRPLRDIGELLREESPTAFPVPAPDDLRGRGFAGVACLACSTPDMLAVHVEAVAVLECRACGAEYTADAVRDHLARWGAVVAWLALCPRRKE
jgi:Zn ribbon nucleic-acid-binding protein